MQAATAIATQPRCQMICIPSASGNPYQSLMYSDAGGLVDVIYAGPRGLRHLTNPEIGLLHIHWDDRLFGRDGGAGDAQEKLDQALAQLRQFKAGGGRILWTIHNDVPHKVGDIEVFRQGRQALVQLADIIHVHAEHAADHMIDVYGADRGKLRVINHPSYLGAYESAEATLTRSFAKSDRREFLFFGMFRGPKGVHKLRVAADKLSRREVPYRLRMYGKAFPSQKRLVRQLGANRNVDLRTDRIPDDEIPEIFASSQVFLAPYESLFTSGSIMLALTFGLPVIGPNLRELRETTPPECHDLLYDPAAPRGLIRAMLSLVEMSDTDLKFYRNKCLEYAQAHAPQNAGRRMAELISGLAQETSHICP